MDISKVMILRFLGDDLIAEVRNRSDKTITLKNPLRIVVVPNPNNPKGPTVGFVPFMDWSSDDTFTLSTDLLLCVAKPQDIFLTKYTEQFSSVILPTKVGHTVTKEGLIY